jgi:hypothetical protein
MCTEQLPWGGYPIAVKYIISYHINELKRATDKSHKEYLDSICEKITEFKRTGCYDFMYTKAKELGYKQNSEIQT